MCLTQYLKRYRYLVKCMNIHRHVHTNTQEIMCPRAYRLSHFQYFIGELLIDSQNQGSFVSFLAISSHPLSDSDMVWQSSFGTPKRDPRFSWKLKLPGKGGSSEVKIWKGIPQAQCFLQIWKSISYVIKSRKQNLFILRMSYSFMWETNTVITERTEQPLTCE